MHQWFLLYHFWMNYFLCIWHNVVMLFVSQTFISAPTNPLHAFLSSWTSLWTVFDSFILILSAIYFLLNVHLPKICKIEPLSYLIWNWWSLPFIGQFDFNRGLGGLRRTGGGGGWVIAFYNQLIKKEGGCLVFVQPRPSSVLGREFLVPWRSVLVWVHRKSVGPYVFLVDPRIESEGRPCDLSYSGSFGIVPGAKRIDWLPVVPNA